MITVLGLRAKAGCLYKESETIFVCFCFLNLGN